MRLVLNVICLIPGGFWLALKRMVRAATLPVSTITPVSLVPLGVEIDPVDSPGPTGLGT